MNRKIVAALFIFLSGFLSDKVFAFAFSDIYVFGDSLSDQGNLLAATGGAVPPSEYSDGSNYGRFTNGLNYVDYLSAQLGVASAPSLLGGHNYAFAGARTSNPILDPSLPPSLTDQFAMYTSTMAGPIDPNALFIVWGGGNNVVDILGKMAAGIPGYDPSGDIAASVGDIKGIVSALATNGAQHILVADLPNLGLTPLMKGLGVEAGATALSVNYNAALEGMLIDLDGVYMSTDFVRFDVFSLMHDIVSNPVAYGLDNVIGTCYSKYVEAGGSTCGTPDTYLFWDAFHPTSAAHAILADGMAKALAAQVPEPETLVLFGAGLLLMRWRKKSPPSTFVTC